MKKKILVVYDEMVLGGSTSSLLAFLHALDYESAQIDLLLYRNKGPFVKEIPSEVCLLPQADDATTFYKKVQKYVLALIKGYIFKALYFNIKYNKKIGLDNQYFSYALAALSRKLKDSYDIAIGYLEFWPNAYVLEEVKAKNKIIWIHTDYFTASLHSKIDTKHFEKANKIVCVSEKCSNNLKIIFPKLQDNIITIENMFEVQDIKEKANTSISCNKFSNKKFTMITVCRLSLFTKGIDRIIRIANRLKSENKSFCWYILGDGEDKEKILAEIKKLELEKYLILLGRKDNPYPYYTKCDVVVIASRYEGKPMVVTEAQILGVPVITTKYESVHEQICNQKDGIIVENNEESLYLGIKRLIDTSSILKHIRSNLESKKFNNNKALHTIKSIMN